MPQNEMLLFCGRNRIRYGYARWGYTRGGGKTWHGGADVEGLDACPAMGWAQGAMPFPARW